MATQLKKFWKFATTYDLLKLEKPGKATEAGAEVTKFALELALALGFLSATIVPPATVAVAGLSGVGLAIRGIRVYRKKTGKEPTLEEWVAIAFPLAYLESLNKLAQTNHLLQQFSPTSISEPVKQQSKKLGEFQLDEHLAKNALTCFHESELAQALNQLLSTQLQEAGIDQNDAQILTAWVAWGTPRYLQQALEDADDSVRQTAQLYGAGHRQEDKYDNIDSYLKEQIATKPFEKIFAEKLKECLEEWTEPGRNGEEFLVKNSQMAWELYDLLGYGGLTQEIVEYLMALLIDSGEFRLVPLFKRLENFYLRWCDGEFMDAAPTTLPQQKMQQLQGQKIQLGVRQVDVYAGLNVMVLLLELHRCAQSKDDLKDKVAFYPCGRKDNEGFDELRLLRIIGYSHCVSLEAFLNTVGQFLRGANLSGANLSRADLRGANLSGANLIGVNFSDANLRGVNLRGVNLIAASLSRANFSDANLSDANLSDANLRGAHLSDAHLSRAGFRGANLRGAHLIGAYLSEADLFGADLTGANLIGAVLSGANLRGAVLSGANLSGTDLENISWNEKTNWSALQSSERAIDVPQALKEKLGLE